MACHTCLAVCRPWLYGAQQFGLALWAHSAAFFYESDILLTFHTYFCILSFLIFASHIPQTTVRGSLPATRHSVCSNRFCAHLYLKASSAARAPYGPYQQWLLISIAIPDRVFCLTLNVVTVNEACHSPASCAEMLIRASSNRFVHQWRPLFGSFQILFHCSILVGRAL